MVGWVGRWVEKKVAMQSTNLRHDAINSEQ